MKDSSLFSIDKCIPSSKLAYPLHLLIIVIGGFLDVRKQWLFNPRPAPKLLLPSLTFTSSNYRAPSALQQNIPSLSPDLHLYVHISPFFHSQLFSFQAPSLSDSIILQEADSASARFCCCLVSPDLITTKLTGREIASACALQE